MHQKGTHAQQLHVPPKKILPSHAKPKNFVQYICAEDLSKLSEWYC